MAGIDRAGETSVAAPNAADFKKAIRATNNFGLAEQSLRRALGMVWFQHLEPQVPTRAASWGERGGERDPAHVTHGKKDGLRVTQHLTAGGGVETVFRLKMITDNSTSAYSRFQNFCIRNSIPYIEKREGGPCQIRSSGQTATTAVSSQPNKPARIYKGKKAGSGARDQTLIGGNGGSMRSKYTGIQGPSRGNPPSAEISNCKSGKIGSGRGFSFIFKHYGNI